MSKKQAKPKKGEEKKYDYVELSKVDDSQSRCYFYAVVMDAQYPHKSYKSDKFICSLKIADCSCHIDKEGGVVETFNLVLFANDFKDLPVSQNIGDIIRVHRAVPGIYKGQRQFTANIFFNSSWALFSPTFTKENEFTPTSFYGKTLSFDNIQMKILRSLRKWVTASFNQYRMLSNHFITELSHISSIQADETQFNFDLEVKVLEIFNLDEFQSELRVIDQSGEIWHSQIHNRKFKNLKAGAFVRVRQATIQNHKGYKRVFGMKPQTNIMVLPEPSMIAKDMQLDCDKITKEYERELLTKGLEEVKGLSQPLEHPVLISHVKVKDDLPLTSFNSIFNPGKSAAKPSYRIRFGVTSISPDLYDDSVLNFLQFCNKKNGIVRPMGSKTDKAKHNEKLCICVEFVCQDYSLITSGD